MFSIQMLVVFGVVILAVLALVIYLIRAISQRRRSEECGCGGSCSASGGASGRPAGGSERVAVYRVTAMHCSNCERAVKNALEALGMVDSVRASHAKQRVEVNLREPLTAEIDKSLREALTGAGFPAE